ncbi:MAG: YdcF family protein [Acidimicrobiia bacterium]
MFRRKEAVPPPPPVPERKPPRWLRPALRVGAGIAVLLCVYYLFNLWVVWWTGQSDEKRIVDAIVVLGAAQYDGRPSPVLASRLDHALDLYTKGLAPTIVVTGGKQPGDRFTEAAASAQYLEARGVPAAAIVQENDGRTSWESLVAASDLLKERDDRSVLLVSDPFHSARIRGIAGELGLKPYVSPTRTSPIKGFTAFRRMLKEAAGVGFARVFGYHRLVSFDRPKGSTLPTTKPGAATTAPGGAPAPSVAGATMTRAGSAASSAASATTAVSRTSSPPPTTRSAPAPTTTRR